MLPSKQEDRAIALRFDNTQDIKIMVDRLESNEQIQLVVKTKFKVGEEDRGGSKIAKIFHQEIDSKDRVKWAIYLKETDNDEGGEGGRVMVEINPDCHEELWEGKGKVLDCLYELEPELSTIRAYMQLETVKPEKKEVVQQLTAKALELALNSYQEQAQETLAKALNLVNFLVIVSGRIEYFGGCLLVFSLQLALFFLSQRGVYLGTLDETWRNMIVIMTCGALGSFLSVALNSEKREFQPETPGIMNIYAGALRIIIGILSAIVAYIAIKAEVVMGFTVDSSSSAASDWIVKSLAVISGFSETFIPDLIKKRQYKDTATDEDTQDNKSRKNKTEQNSASIAKQADRNSVK